MVVRGIEGLNATVRWTVARDGSTERNIYLRNAQMQTIPLTFEKQIPPSGGCFLLVEVVNQNQTEL